MPGRIFYHTLDGEPPHGGLPPKFNEFRPQPHAQAPVPANGPFFMRPQAPAFVPAPVQAPAPVVFQAPAPAPVQVPFNWNQNVFFQPPAAAPFPAPAQPRVVFVQASQASAPAPASSAPQFVFVQPPNCPPCPCPAPAPAQPAFPIQWNLPFRPAPAPVIVNSIPAPSHIPPFAPGNIIIHRASTPYEIHGGVNGLPRDRFHFRVMLSRPNATVAELLEVLNYPRWGRVFTMHEMGGGRWVEGLTLRKGDRRTLRELGWEGAGWAAGGRGGGKKPMWICCEQWR